MVKKLTDMEAIERIRKSKREYAKRNYAMKKGGLIKKVKPVGFI